ncbi:MAG: DUF4186 domain-containing protein [Clostridia bacterium]|nr:DUF4186 domain-containing protein [Clostridia bacterium]
MQTKEQALEKLARSKFRSSFHLTAAERAYCTEKGMDTIRRHAADFVQQKLAPVLPENDGKQTPMRGHPAFNAMHATACCCRGCLNKWYRVPVGVLLTEAQRENIVALTTAWIEAELKTTRDEETAEQHGRGGFIAERPLIAHCTL